MAQHQFIKSTELFQRSKKTSPGGVHSPVRAFKGVEGTPVFVDRAEGALLFDVDGNSYIDFCMSWGPLLLGHRDPDVLEAIQKSLERGWTFGTAEDRSLELAEWMIENVAPVEKVRFVNSGTEAVMSALRLARAATGRNKILKFDGCYHGHVDSMLVKAGSGLADMPSPDSAGVSPAQAGETVIIPLNDLNALEQALQLHGKEIAAVILEPIPANNGLLPQTQEFLEQTCQKVRDSGGLVIFDEVISGFRIALGGMSELTGICPDLVTYGKVIGGGFPVGAYAGKKELLDQVAPQGPVYQAGTLSANPVAMTAGLATLKKIQNLNPFQKLKSEVEKLGQRLEKAALETSDIPIHVQTFGSLFWVVAGNIQSSDGIIRSPDQTPIDHPTHFKKLFHSLLRKGVYLAPSAYEVGFYSTAHSPEEQDQFVQAFRESLEEK